MVAFLVLAPAFLAGLVYLMNLAALRTEKIEVYGALLLNAADVENEVRDDLSGKRWFFLPKNNFFMISTASLRAGLLNKFSQASEIKVAKKFPSGIAVTLEERALWGIYCVKDEAITRSCLYVDTRGIAYEDVSNVEGSLLPVIYAYRGAAAGAKVADEGLLDFFAKAKGAAAGIQADLLSLTLSTSTPEDVRLNFFEGWQAIVSRSRPPEEWAALLKTVLEKEIGVRRGQLDYVDLRFGNKVFYKYR
mgnify:CR=1 FL=1